MIIGLGNGKGGVGKSTIAANVVVDLNDRGYPTALVDAEHNYPTAKRLLRFDPDIVAQAAAKLEEIQDSVKQLTEKGYHVIVDTPGNDSEQLTTVCLLSDLLIVPLQTAEQDLLQTVPVLSMIKALQARTGGVPEAHLVFSQSRRKSRAEKQLRDQLAQHKLPIAKTVIRRLDEYQRNVSVMRDPKLNLHGEADDIRSLVDELIIPHLVEQKGVANE